MQGSERGTGNGRGTKERRGNGKATEDGKGKWKGKGKGYGKGNGIVEQMPGGDDISRAVALQLQTEMYQADLDTEG